MPDFPLVSIITPCYNGANYLDKYFDSILNQTYSHLELVFINDGSTDNSEQLAISYRKKLEDKGIIYKYIKQDNMGLPGAINTGLRLFSGKYLTWPDCDDWMTPDCIEKKVDYLETHPNKALVQCKCAFVNENDLNNIVSICGRKNTDNGWMFDDLILEKDALFACGTYLVRSDCFAETHPTNKIYDENRAGQNYQMLLPLLYKYECGFIDDVLYYYRVSDNSHSHKEKDYYSNVEKTKKHQEILEHVLDEINMPENERQKYQRIIEKKYIRKRMRLAVKYKEKRELIKHYNQLTSYKPVMVQDRILYMRSKRFTSKSKEEMYHDQK